MRALLTLAASAVLAAAASTANVTYLKAEKPVSDDLYGKTVAVASPSQYFVAAGREYYAVRFPETTDSFSSYFNNKFMRTVVGAPGERLGADWNMAASPTHLIVGAIYESSEVTAGDDSKAHLFTGTPNTDGSANGGAHLYNINQETGAITWAGIFKAPTVVNSPTDCGMHVAIDGKTAAMTCPSGDDTPVWVFTQDSTGAWGEGVPLTTEAVGVGYFGEMSIALSGKYLAVLAVTEMDGLEFAVVIFENKGAEWVEHSVIYTRMQASYYVAPSLALEGTLLVLGNPSVGGCTLYDQMGGYRGDYSDECEASGEVYFFRIGEGVPEFGTKAQFPITQGLFGLRVAIGEVDGKEVVYVPAMDSTCGSGLDVKALDQTCMRQTGTVYTYTNAGVAGTPKWEFTGAVKSLGPIYFGRFGYDVAASNNTLLVGAMGEGNALGGVNAEGVGSRELPNSGAAYFFVFETDSTSCAVNCNACVDFSHGHAHDIEGGVVEAGILVTCAEGSFPTSSAFANGETCTDAKAINATCVPAASTTDVAFAAQVASFEDEAALATWLEANNRVFFTPDRCLECSETLEGEQSFIVSQCLRACVIAPAATARQIEFETGYKTIICDVGVTLQDCARDAVCEGQATAGGACGNITCPSCKSSSSKKGLLGLLGLLGLIPLLLCCCLLWLCCIRRRKADPEVHFATFDPYAQEAVVGGGASMICTANPVVVDSIACGSGTVVYP